MTDTQEPQLLPEGTRMLHIGPPKTGTSAVQLALHHKREALRAHGVEYPGTDRRSREAGWAALGLAGPRGRRPPRPESWDALVGEVAEAGERRVCISNEDFARADVDDARKLVANLGGERTHVVFVARRLDRLLPSQWQQRVRVLHTNSYATWLETVLGDFPNNRLWQSIWVPHDLVAVVERWAQVVDRDRITVIVSDDSDRDLLLRSFETLLGLPPEMLEHSPRVANRSMSLNETELVRQVNIAFRDNRWSDKTFRHLLRHGMLPELLNHPRSAEDASIPPLPAWAAKRVADLSAERAAALPTLGVRVVGDPDSLRTEYQSGTDESTEPVTVAPELAARAVAGTIRGAVQRESRLRRRHRAQLSRARRRLRRARRVRSGRTVAEVSSRELLGVVARRAGRRLRARVRR